MRYGNALQLERDIVLVQKALRRYRLQLPRSIQPSKSTRCTVPMTWMCAPCCQQACVDSLLSSKFRNSTCVGKQIMPGRQHRALQSHRSILRQWPSIAVGRRRMHSHASVDDGGKPAGSAVISDKAPFANAAQTSAEIVFEIICRRCTNM